jgi:hypothetical protein
VGGNILCLGDEPIISMSQKVTVNWRIRTGGFEMKAIDYAMFTVGGAFQCSWESEIFACS